MRQLSFFLLALGLSLFFSAWICMPKKKKPLKTFTISGTVFTQGEYCGGAVPSEEQLHPKPAPAPALVLYVREGNVNTGSKKLVDSVTSDANGNFSLQLPAGNYCFVEGWKKGRLVMPKDDQFSSWDTACYRENYSSCDFSLDVKAATDSVKIILPRHCAWSQPCCSYHGPLPPAANPGPRNNMHQE